MKAFEAFPYIPENDYESISPKNFESITNALKPFMKNSEFYIENHLTTAEALRKYINSTDQVSTYIRSSFLERLKEIETSVASIITLASDLKKDITNDTLHQKAMKDYYDLFSDNSIDDKKVDYAKLLKLYESIKSCNLQLKENWMRLKEIFGNIEVGSHNHKFLQRILGFKIYPRLDLISHVDLLLRQLAFILQINSEKVSTDNVRARGKYTPMVKYSFGSIFDPRVSGIIEHLNDVQVESNEVALKQNEAVKGQVVDPMNHRKLKEKGTKKTIRSWDDVKESSIKDNSFIDCRGDEIFNQGYIHTLKINQNKLRIEELKIQKSIYIETHLGIEDKAFQRELTRGFISNRNEQDKINAYNNFLDDFFFS